MSDHNLLIMCMVLIGALSVSVFGLVINLDTLKYRLKQLEEKVKWESEFTTSRFKNSSDLSDMKIENTRALLDVKTRK